MARGEKPAGESSLSVRVYVQPTAGTDGQLFVRGIQGSKSQSGFLHAMAIRGWINLLHGTTAQERSMQLRALGLPDELVAEIDALAGVPQLLALQARDTVATNIGVTPVAQPAETASQEPVAAPVAAPAKPTFSVPEHSRLGNISSGGGLS